MELTITSELLFAPHYCAATLASEDPEGFIDCHMDIPYADPHVYLAIAGYVKPAARELGMVDPETYRAALDRLEAQRAHVEALEQRVRELEGFKESVYTIRAAGYTTQRKPGRPRKEAVSSGQS